MSCFFSENNHPLGASLRDLTPAGRPFQQVCLDTWGEEHLLPYQSPGHNCDRRTAVQVSWCSTGCNTDITGLWRVWTTCGTGSLPGHVFSSWPFALFWICCLRSQNSLSQGGKTSTHSLLPSWGTSDFYYTVWVKHTFLWQRSGCWAEKRCNQIKLRGLSSRKWVRNPIQRLGKTERQVK